MSLKNDFYDGVTGLLQQCDAAFAAGQSFVSTNQTAISTDLKDNAAKGLTTFTLKYVITYNTAILRGNSGNNLILKSYLAGIKDGLAAQAIYDFECVPTLDVSLINTTSVALNFTFQTA